MFIDFFSLQQTNSDTCIASIFASGGLALSRLSSWNTTLNPEWVLQWLNSDKFNGWHSGNQLLPSGQRRSFVTGFYGPSQTKHIFSTPEDTCCKSWYTEMVPSPNYNALQAVYIYQIITCCTDKRYPLISVNFTKCQNALQAVSTTEIIRLLSVAYLGFHKGGLQLSSSLYLYPSLPFPPFPSLPLEVGPLRSSYGSGERCKLPQRGLGQSPSRNRFWCILALKSGIWWQRF